MADNSYRIRAKVGEDENVVRVNLKQGIKTLNILSLEIDPEDTYDVQTADYGVIIGRVLANDAFGVPNVKVSVFIPIDNEDKNDIIISNEYPYITTQSRNINGVKYNLISTRKNSPGTFPNKRMILDNNGSIEVFDKYWKYTTTTNESGDYMLFGVPTGTCQVHYDCDLSDVGMISQHPYDFVAKGYDKNLFKSMTEFTETNLASAVHIISQDKSIYVYPFWGDKDRNKIGITRYDIKIDYKFEPSCVFMGSSITDPEGTYITRNGKPNGSNGLFSSLSTSSGDIEIIIKRQDGSVEELKDNVKGIIDGNGVWCYQIPMNLDRIGTDEYGNMIAISDPNKGIPTRARVRFRISLNTNNDASGGITAKILVPCNPELKYSEAVGDKGVSEISDPLPKGIKLTFDSQNQATVDVSGASDYYNKYEFGSNTPDEYFRDLYWGKVYSVKQYYPRFQYEDTPKAVFPMVKDLDWSEEDIDDGEYGVVDIEKDDRDANYDLFGYPPQFSFNQSCISSIDKIAGINTFPYTTMYSSGEVGIDNKIIDYFLFKMTDISTTSESFRDKGLHFCFENDWINGCLYFPRFELINDNSGSFDYFGEKSDSGSGDYNHVYLSGRHHFNWRDDYSKFFPKSTWLCVNSYNNSVYDKQVVNSHYLCVFSRCPLKHGIITKQKTFYGDDVFYYRCGTVQYADGHRSTFNIAWLSYDFSAYDRIGDGFTGSTYIYRRLYSTDIILLGNLEDIYDHIPKLYNSLPTTSATFPPLAPDKQLGESGMSKIAYFNQAIKLSGDVDLVDLYGNTEDSGYEYIKNKYGNIPLYEVARQEVFSDNSDYNNITEYYSKGGNDKQTERLLARVSRCYSLFFGINTWQLRDILVYDIPTFINTSRICELDVHNDRSFNVKFGTQTVTIPTNGMIDVYDISTNKNRSLFATMNYDITKYCIDSLGYRKFEITPIVVSAFDGRLKEYINNYPNGSTSEIPWCGNFLFYAYGNEIRHATDDVDTSYMLFRFGVDGEHNKKPYRQCEIVFPGSGIINENYANGPLYLPQNSFYFYFGLRSGFSALDVLREKYVGEDEINVEGVGAIIVSQVVDDISCNDDNQIIGSCYIDTHGIPYPILYKMYNGAELVSEGYLVEGGTTISNLLVATYVLRCTDSRGREYENVFSIMGYGPSIGYTTNYDRETDLPTLTLNTVNGYEIQDYEEIPGSNDSFYIFYLSEGDLENTKVLIRFSKNFDHVTVVRNYNAIPTVYFQTGVSNIEMYSTIIKGSSTCLSTTNNIALRSSFNLSLKLNGVPVRYVRGWSDYYDWGVGPDDPDSELSGGEYNLWDALMTLYPSVSTRTFKFEDSDLTYDEQLSYISNMYQSICGDKPMELVNTGDADNTLLVTLSPNIGYDEEHFLNPSLKWGQVLSGETIQITSLTGRLNSSKNVPYIVGSNYPRSKWYNGKTFFKKGGSSCAYVNNATMWATGVNGNDLFSVNLFGCRDVNNNMFDEPSQGITPEISSSTLTKVDLRNDVTSLFGLRTLDNRFDYQFSIRTPLILPSGYQKFIGLQRCGLILGSAWIDLYGGLRLNYGTNMRISCYKLEDGVITGGPQRNPTATGLNDKAKLVNRYIVEDGMADMAPTTNESAITICYEDENGSECIDIDHVQYGVVNTGQGYQYFDAHFIDCSSDFANGLVKSGKHESIQISYNSGVSVEHLIESKYDVKYETTFDTEEMMSDTETHFVCASFAGSSLNIKLSTDNVWAGVTYTDISTSGTTDNIYPTWAQHDATDIQPLDRNAELSVYQCQINSASGELSIVEEYHLDMVLSADTLPSIPQYDKDYYVSAYYEEDGVKTPINDSMAENNIQFHLGDSDTAPTATTMSAHSFLVIPTKKIYTTPSEPTLLKQGISFNAGYAYYTGQITITLDTMDQSFTMKLHTPLRGANDIIDREVDDLIYDSENEHDIHTIGEINEYSCDMGVITYNSDKEEFYVTLSSGYTTYNVFFRMENGLRYKVVVNILGDV